MNEEQIATEVIDGSMAIHKALGPGLLESAYSGALCIELDDRGLRYAREQPIEAVYRGRALGVGYRADFIVESLVLVEVKSVETLSAAHVAQTLSYLRLGRLKLGLLINFSAPLLKQGLRRVVNNL